MSSSREQQHLLNVLKDRNISLLGPDDVAWAFDHGETTPAITSWIQEYLSPSTLLTREELAFHDAHPETATSITENVGRPLPDEQFEAAIISLEASTTAIEQQCSLLEAQKQALSDIKTRNANHGSSNATQTRHKKLTREKAQLDLHIEELADGLQASLRASTKQAEAATSSMHPSIDRILEKDDRLLDGLQKLLPKLEHKLPDQDDSVEITQLCDTLTTLFTQEIRLRLNAAYRACTGASALRRDNHSAEVDKQNAALRAELEELSGEIDGLAAMAVDGQYRVPLLCEVQSFSADVTTDRARWSDYVAATLQYLTARLVAFEEHYMHLHAHQGALEEVANALAATLASSKMKHDVQHADTRSPATPVAKGLKPLRLVQANFSEPEDPVAQLLRSFDLRVTDTSDIPKLTRTLGTTIGERRMRLEQLRESTERAITEQLSETVVKADRDVGNLLAAVFAYSPFGSVRLVDAQVEAEVGRLEAKTQEMGEEMRGLDMDAIARMIRERQRDVLGK